jgi:DNA recombination protein RmuC
MSTETSLILVLIIAGFVAVILFFNKKLSELSEKNKPDETLTEWLKTMQTSIDNTSKTLNTALSLTSKNLSDTLQKGNQDLNSRLDNAARLMSQIQRDAGKFSELSQSMKNLQDYLRSPKLRGNIGEQVLKDLISQMFPKNSFYLQHSFKSGDKVDAAIKTDAGLLPIDAKFPAENFQRMMAAESEAEKESAKKEFVKDVKRHISDISKKYILPEEGTMDFALMYIPSEPIYYEAVNITELTEYARENRVYPVSPNTLYANLQVILLSYQGKEIEAKTRQVFTLLRAIQKDYSKLNDDLSVLNRHITNSYNQMANVNSGFTLLGQKLSSTGALEEGDKKKPEQPEIDNE